MTWNWFRLSISLDTPIPKRCFSHLFIIMPIIPYARYSSVRYEAPPSLINPPNLPCRMLPVARPTPAQYSVRQPKPVPTDNANKKTRNPRIKRRVTAMPVPNQPVQSSPPLQSIKHSHSSTETALGSYSSLTPLPAPPSADSDRLAKCPKTSGTPRSDQPSSVSKMRLHTFLI